MTAITSENDAIKEGTTASFRADVIAESARQPVLVDFWAPWCEPCKQLTPILEKVVNAAAGKVKLVKINIDEHPQVATQLGVKSIPAVFAFQKGQPADGFMGALPESQIKAFLERLVGPLGGESEALITAGAAAMTAGEHEQAADLYSQALAEDPTNLTAVGGLVRAILGLGELSQAKEILASVPPGSDTDPAIIAARAALEIAEQAETVGDLSELERQLAADPKNHKARLDLAIAMNARGMREPAADALLEIIQQDRNWNDDGARKQLLQFFEAWGYMEPETLSARRKLSAVLFS